LFPITFSIAWSKIQHISGRSLIDLGKSSNWIPNRKL